MFGKKKDKDAYAITVAKKKYSLIYRDHKVRRVSEMVRTLKKKCPKSKTLRRKSLQFPGWTLLYVSSDCRFMR